MAVLKLGAHGGDVRTLQRLLIKVSARPRSRVDGEFGPKTEQSVRFFQKREKLKVDGIAGRKTLAALEALTEDELEIRMPGYRVTMHNKLRSHKARARETARLLDDAKDLRADLEAAIARLDGFAEAARAREARAVAAFAEYQRLVDEILRLKKEFDRAKTKDRSKAIRLRRDIKKLQGAAAKSERLWSDTRKEQRRDGKTRDVYRRLVTQLLAKT